jgi:hypothetical protein
VGKKSTKNEIMLRIDTVYGMLCDGKACTEIIRQGTELWDISERQIENYIAKARVLLEDDCRMTREAFMAEALAGYRSLREQAERRGQLMCAKQCIDSMVDLTAIKK